MSIRKLKLQTSINTINSKSKVAKQKLSKLKVILANPYKPEIVQLTEEEVSELGDIIINETKKSGLSGKQYAKDNNISMGLESSLRNISNKKTSCVLISQTIMPKFIINQIGYLSREMDKTVPVYVVADLEKMSEKMFGINALIITFPRELQRQLSKWVAGRTKSKEDHWLKKNLIESVKPKKIIESKVDLSSIYLPSGCNGRRAFVPEVVKFVQQTKIVPQKDWSGDYISFGAIKEATEDMEVEESDFEKEKDRVQAALQKMTSSVKGKKALNMVGSKISPEDVVTCVELPKIVIEESDDDDFIAHQSYIGLNVHKIQGNPNRKPKKKRKSKKKVQNK